MKRILALLLVLLAGFYVGWPAWSGYRLHQALEARDEAAVERGIDFASVRRHLEPVVTAEVGQAFDAQIADLGPAGGLLAPILRQQVLPKVAAASLDTLLQPGNVVKLYAERNNLKAAAERLVMDELGKPGGVLASLGSLGGLGGLIGGGGGGTEAAPLTTGSVQLPGGLGQLGGKLGGLNVEGLGGKLPDQIGGAVGQPTPDVKAILTRMMEKRRASTAQEAPAAKTATGRGGFGLGNIKGFGFNGPLAMVASVAGDAAAPKADVTAELAFSGSAWRLVRIVPVR